MNACALGLALPLVQSPPSPPPGVSVLFLGIVEAYVGASKVTACKTKRIGALCSFVPREPPLRRAFVSRNLLGVVVPDPGVPGRREGGWSFSAPIPREGPRGLNTSSRGSYRPYRKRHCTWSPRRRFPQPALERGRGRQGRFRSG